MGGLDDRVSDSSIDLKVLTHGLSEGWVDSSQEGFSDIVSDSWIDLDSLTDAIPEGWVNLFQEG